MRPYLAPPAPGDRGRGQPPTFSVVIACHQAAHVVSEAVGSALEQTYPPLEVIVCDDGSTDDLASALEPVSDRVVVLRGAHGGPAAARNAGFRVARGDYIVILDADDVFFAERLEAMAELIGVRSDLDIVTTNAVMEVDGRPVRDVYNERWAFETLDQRRAILERNFVFGLAAVRRMALERCGGMDETRPINPHAEDWDLWIRMIHTGSKVGLVNDVLARNRLGAGSLSADRRGRLEGRVAVLDKALAMPGLRPVERDRAKRTRARHLVELRALEARAAVREGDRSSRRRSASVVFGPLRDRGSLLPRTRLRAAAWALAPDRFRARPGVATESEWEGAAGTRHRSRSNAITVAFYTDANQTGGAELSLENLLRALSPRVRAVVVGTDELVITRLASARGGTRSVLIPVVRSITDVTSVAAHRRAFRSVSPDIIQVNLNHPWACTWAQLAATSIHGVRVIAVEHLPRPPLSATDPVVKRALEHRLDAHVTVGRRSADELAALTGLKRERLATIYNGISPGAEVEHVERGGSFVIGSVGRLHAQKGYDVLVDALTGLDGVTAVLVGDGEEREPLLKRAAGAAVRDRLVLDGWADDARRHLASFDVFVLPSRFEAFPLTVLEAMSAGVPVVATDVGSVAEAVVEGSTGLLVPPGDAAALASAITRLRDDPPLRQRMGARGRRRVLELFTDEGMASRYEALYEEVLA